MTLQGLHTQIQTVRPSVGVLANRQNITPDSCVVFSLFLFSDPKLWSHPRNSEVRHSQSRENSYRVQLLDDDRTSLIYS